MRPRIGLTALTGGLIVLIGLMLAACGSVIDADQARLCRSIPEALHPEGAIITETALTPLQNAAKPSLRLTYRVRIREITVPRFIICRFDSQTGAERFDLVGLETERGPMSGVKLLILKRWWLSQTHPTPAATPAFSLDAKAAFWVQQGLNGLVLAGIYGLIATGFALVYGLLGRINLAFGAIAVMGGVNMLVVVGIAALAGRLSGMALTLSLVVGIFASALLSCVTGKCVVIPLATRSRAPQTTLIGTAALAIVLAEIARITSADRLNYLPALLNRPLYVAGEGAFIATITPGQLLAAGLCLCGASFLLALIAFSRFGRAWRAHADDPQMSEILGIRVPALQSLTFSIAGAAAGLAGAVVVIAFGTVQAEDGLSLTLKALISAIIGGIGSVPGAFVGAVLVASVETLWSSAFDIAYRDVVTYSLLAAFLVLRPGGILNRAAPSPRDI